MSGELRVERRADGAVILWIDNPAHRNSLNDAIIGQLIETLGELAADAACRAIVLRGTGGTFCAGRELNDLVALQAQDAETIDAAYRYLRLLHDRLYYCPKPTIVAIERYCLGAGAALAGWADLAIAEEDALIGYPEVRVGLTPSSTTVSLIRAVPRKVAMDLLLTARNISGTEALAMGLVSRVVPKGGLDEELEAMIAALLRAGPMAVTRTKELVWKTEDVDYRSGCATAVDTISVSLTMREAREGVSAFVEKRKPNW
jgi:enoyl-CoA hydratase/carnithine racemase